MRFTNEELNTEVIKLTASALSYVPEKKFAKTLRIQIRQLIA